MHSSHTQQTFFSMIVFKDIATRGKSTMGWYIGFKLHLLCNEKGEIINFNLTRACVDDRDVDVMNALTTKHSANYMQIKGTYLKLFLVGFGIRVSYYYRASFKHETEAYATL